MIEGAIIVAVLSGAMLGQAALFKRFVLDKVRKSNKKGA